MRDRDSGTGIAVLLVFPVGILRHHMWTKCAIRCRSPLWKLAAGNRYWDREPQWEGESESWLCARWGVSCQGGTGTCRRDTVR